MLVVGLAVTCWHQRLDRQADQLVQIVAAQGSELPVGEDDPAVRIGDQDLVGESIGERLPGVASLHRHRRWSACRHASKPILRRPAGQDTTLPGTAASELASYGSSAQRTIRTGRRA